ncbi:major capsid protein [Aeromicrobium piscarium]|uniref:Major capsid protein E n=1 Tax=Aeromicrobium piscarium TaxID=2590901 RepID=A0A554SP60_9ACTN|nr:major capsid protein [Aeromicrobium piscarium]TSD68127.1 major capsid protein E [Aeromicrobium piscarium]
MPLWTEVIDPSELTGYARAEQAIYEAQSGSLARYLPNREVADIAVSFIAGSNGLVEEARYRAYDAEPEYGRGEVGEEVMLKLPAVSRRESISEYQQLRARGAVDEQYRTPIERAMRRTVRSIVDRVERTRGIVINTGRAAVTQSNFSMDDDFGRDPSMSVVAPTLWTDLDADRIEYLQTLQEAYIAANGVPPGSILMSNTVFASLSRGAQFRTQLNNGASRPAVADEVRQYLISADLPPVDIYKRSTKAGPVLPGDSLFLLPAPVDTDDAEGTELGATFWGQTLTASLPDYEIDAEEQPGIVVAAHRNDRAPAIAEVEGDSISLPVLANANLAMKAKVL